MASAEQILSRWPALSVVVADAEQRDRWQSEPSGHLLHHFRTDGAGGDALVAGMDHAEDR